MNAVVPIDGEQSGDHGDDQGDRDGVPVKDVKKALFDDDKGDDVEADEGKRGSGDRYNDTGVTELRPGLNHLG